MIRGMDEADYSTLELVERVGASYALVSSGAGGGSYNFPHALAMEAVRENRQPVTGSGVARMADHDLGIHVTGSVLDDPTGAPLGSVATVVPHRSSRPIRLFRLMDGSRNSIDLRLAREVRR